MLTKRYRQGAIGALLDVYENVISDLKRAIEAIPDNKLTSVIDTNTTDENCKSVQSILSHVVHAAYGYATSIHNLKGHNVQRPPKTFHSTIKEYLTDLTNAFAFTESVFEQFDENDVEHPDPAMKISSSWGQVYDIEQMMEHAIVHVMRHHRQLRKLEAI